MWDYNPTPSSQGGYVHFTFEVHGIPVNDPPEIIGPNGDEFIGAEDSDLLLSADGGVVLNDLDSFPAGNEIMEVKVSVAVGTIRLPLSSASGLHLLSGDQPKGSSELSARGGLEDLNRALQGLIYQPPAEWSGDDEITFWVSDLGDGIHDNSLDAQNTFYVTVNAVADAPVVQLPGSLRHLDEDTSLMVDFIYVSDSDQKSTLKVEAQPEYGTVDVVPELLENLVWRSVELSRMDIIYPRGGKNGGLAMRGAADDVDKAMRMLVYTPPMDHGGQVTLTVRVTDETGLSMSSDTYMYVKPINDPPQIALSWESGATPTLKMTAGGEGSTILGITVADVDVGDSSDLCANIQEIQGSSALALRLAPEFGSVWIVADRAVGVWVVDSSSAGPGETLLLRGSVRSLNEALDGLVYYNAPSDFSGRDSVELTVDDGGNCGYGGVSSVTRSLAVDVAPYDPPLNIVFAPAVQSSSPLFIQEDEVLTLPNVTVTGGSVGERAAVEVVIIAISGNVTLQDNGAKAFEVLDNTGKSGERLRLRGSPALLTAALVGLTFQPRSHFFGCWDRNGTCDDDTPVRSSRLRGHYALARVHVIVTPDEQGGGVISDGLRVEANTSWSMVSVMISVGWLNDPPIVDTPDTIVLDGGSAMTLVPGIYVADPDAMDQPEGLGRLDVKVSASMGHSLAVNTAVSQRNGLRNMGLNEQEIRLRGQPEFINNALATVTISRNNATNSRIYNDGEVVDTILVEVSDLGFSGAGAAKQATASIMVEAGLAVPKNSLTHDVFELEKMLPLVTTAEGSAVALPGLEGAFSGGNHDDELTVVVSSREGYLSLGSHSRGVAEAAAKEDWGPEVTLIEVVGGAEQILPEVQVRL